MQGRAIFADKREVALFVQRAWRGKRARKYVKDLHIERQDNAAMLLQKRVRSKQESSWTHFVEFEAGLYLMVLKGRYGISTT